MTATLNHTRTARPTRLMAVLLLAVMLTLLAAAHLAAQPATDGAHQPMPVAVSVAVPADTQAHSAPRLTVETALPLPQAEPVPPAE